MASYDDFNAQPDINNPEFKDGDGENTIRSISTAQQALEIGRNLEDNDRNRDIKRARVLAAFNGDAPYSDGELTANGQNYRYNISFGYLEGSVSRAVVPYNKLSLNIENIVDFDANKVSEEKINFIKEEYIAAIKRWGYWKKFISRLNQDLVINGFNTAIFPSVEGCWPIFIEQQRGFTNDQAPNEVRQLQVFVWKKDYLINELYEKIADDQTNEESGWNVKNVKQALMAAAPDDIYRSPSTRSGEWTRFEEAVRAGSLYASLVGAKVVKTYHVFAAEIDGSVTHYVVVRDSRTDSTEAEGIELFKKEDQFESFSDIMAYFDMEAGDGNWHGSRGLGRRLFNTHAALDKFRCSLLDQAHASGLQVIQPGDQASKEGLELVVMGPFVVLPPSITISSTSLPPLAATSFQADQLLTATGQQRAGDLVPEVQATNVSDKTATQARIDAGQRNLITSGNLERYLDPLEDVMTLIFKRLSIENSEDPDAKIFQENLKKRGVTREDLVRVKRAKASGKISDVLGEDQAITQIVLAEFRGDADVNQKQLKRMRLESLLTPKEVDDILLPDDDQTLTIEQARQQIMEIDDIKVGTPIPVSPRDNHQVHIQTAAKWLGNEFVKHKQGQGETVQAMQAVLEHMGQHLNELVKDPSKKQVAIQYKQAFQDIEKTIQGIGQNALQEAQGAAEKAKQLAVTPQEAQQADQLQQQVAAAQSQTPVEQTQAPQPA